LKVHSDILLLVSQPDCLVYRIHSRKDSLVNSSSGSMTFVRASTVFAVNPPIVSLAPLAKVVCVNAQRKTEDLTFCRHFLFRICFGEGGFLFPSPLPRPLSIHTGVPGTEAHGPVDQVKHQEHDWKNYQKDIVNL